MWRMRPGNRISRRAAKAASRPPRRSHVRAGDDQAIELAASHTDHQSELDRADGAPETIVRFDRHQRLQHFLMMATFIALAVTGLPQKFSDYGASQWWVELLGGVDNVRFIHHAAGWVMIADCAYHVLYLVFRVGVQGRLDALRMIPTLKDFHDAAGMFLYFLGAKDEKPKFDRFTYLEKFEYWAVGWGIVMIGISGLIILFPTNVTQYLPGAVLPVSHAIHSDEAMLAVGWIVIAHMFYVHLAPGTFPFNPSIFTGRLSRKRYREEHALEYERMYRRKAPAPVPPAVGEPVEAQTPRSTSRDPGTEDGAR